MSPRKPWKLLVGPKGARVMAKERTVGGPVYLFAYDNETRKYERRSLGFTVRDAAGALVPDAQAKAKKLAAEVSNRLLAGERAIHPAEPPAVTLGEVARLFERERLPRQTPRSQGESRRLLACWLGYLGEEFQLARFHSASWSRFHRERAAGLLDGRGHVRTTQKPVGPSTIRKELKFLRTLCTFASEYRLADGRYLLAGDPTRGMEIPLEDDPKRPLFDENRYAQLLTAASARLRPLLVLAHETGRRISAIVGLRWDDWCPTVGLYGVLTWRAAHDKLGKTWHVPVTQAVRDALARLERRGPYLFPTLADPARPITRTVARNWLRRAERHAELMHLPGGGWHAFRRAWATSRKHLSLKDVAYAGGWSETSTLVSVYQQPDVESLAQVVEGGREKVRAVQ